MNYTTLATTESTYKQIITLLERGFVDADGITRKPNHRAAFALKLERVTGCRIGDVVKLRPSDFVKDGNDYRINIKEEKTKKPRRFTISPAAYAQIMEYCARYGIGSDSIIINVTERAIQKQLKTAVDALGLVYISTHSIRKMSGCDIYEITNHDIQAVREFYQHGDTKTTIKYLTHSSETLKNALLQLSM